MTDAGPPEGARATDAPDDPIERWGRRIGRSLGFVACVALGFYLYVTYLR